MTQVVNSDSLTYLSHLSISFSICDTACLFNATLENKKNIEVLGKKQPTQVTLFGCLF